MLGGLGKAAWGKREAWGVYLRFMGAVLLRKEKGDRSENGSHSPQGLGCLLYTRLSQQKHLLIYHRGTAVVNSAEGATVRAQGHCTSVAVGRQPPPSQPGNHQMQNKRSQVPFAVYDSFVPPLPWKQSHFWSQCWLLKPQSLLKAW